MNSSKYLPHIDILRIVACFLVIVNHTNSRLFMGMPPVYPVWFFSVAMFFISKIAVPIFIMISGALLLGRDESCSKALKRAGRIALVTLLYSAFYFICDAESLNASAVGGFFETLYSDVQTRAFWYLYLYIGLMLMLPLLQRLVKGMKERDFVYFLVLTFMIVAVLPPFFDKSGLPYYNSSIITPMFNGYLGYFMAGYFIERIVKKRTKPLFWTAFALFCASVIFSVIMTYREFTANFGAYPYWDNRLAFNVAIPSVTLYYMATFINADKLSEKMSAAIKYAGSLTFGIYLISDMLIFRMETAYERVAQYVPNIIAVAGMIIAVVILGAGFTAAVKKLPILKKLI